MNLSNSILSRIHSLKTFKGNFHFTFHWLFHLIFYHSKFAAILWIYCNNIRRAEDFRRRRLSFDWMWPDFPQFDPVPSVLRSHTLISRRKQQIKAPKIPFKLFFFSRKVSTKSKVNFVVPHSNIQGKQQTFKDWLQIFDIFPCLQCLCWSREFWHSVDKFILYKSSFLNNYLKL